MRAYVSLILLAMCVVRPALAQDPDVSAGKDHFDQYCAQCHGPDATGNGPMAEILAVETPDLTTLAAANGGKFPMAAVARQIDGRARILSHGGDMPVFGPFFAGEDVILQLPSGQPMATSQPIADLLAYLESVQSGS